MLHWLRLLLMVLYAPARAMREVRDHPSLAACGLVTLLVHFGFWYCLRLLFTGTFIGPLPAALRLLEIALVGLLAASSLIVVALIFSPLALFLANVFERRASFRLLLQQEYSAVTSTLFYAVIASSLIGTVLTVLGKVTGLQEAAGRYISAQAGATRFNVPPQIWAASVSGLIVLLLFGVFATMALHLALRASWIRSLILVLLCGGMAIPAAKVLLPIFMRILASPLLLLMLFFWLRGYFTDFARNQRARAAFKQNLEAATLNPADASAHYNLGLIHQQRGENAAARERFERAVQIDGDELDAYYQLGRIARQEKRYAEAIGNFEQVVAHDPSHAQNEIWREVGATYLAAGQFEDARAALQRFLERRESDPEGLYLMGRAHEGLGHRSEAVSLMEACINAVRSAPAYKYRMEKRWLNEAQQYLRTK